MTSSILYIGGSYPQHHAVRALREQGFSVHLTDRNHNPPSAAEAWKSYPIDAGDTPALAKLAAQLRQDGSFLGAYGIADYAFAAVAEINREQAGRCAAPGSLATMLDKAATKTALGASCPQFLGKTLWAGQVSDFPGTLPPQDGPTGSKAIVKPVGVHASAGITEIVLGDADALRHAVAAAAALSPTILIEEFLEGDVCNLDCLVVDGKAHLISQTRRVADTRLNFLPWLQIQPSRQEIANLALFEQMGQAIADGLHYPDGPFTVDYIDTPLGPRILEVSPHFHSIGLEILRGNGNPLRAWFRLLAQDTQWKADLAAQGERAGALLMLRGGEAGKLHQLDGLDDIAALPGIADKLLLKDVGQQINPASASGSLIGLYWIVGDTQQALLDQAETIRGLFKPVIGAD